MILVAPCFLFFFKTLDSGVRITRLTQMANSDPIFSLNNVTPKETIKFIFPTKMMKSLLSIFCKNSRIKLSGPTGGFMSLDCLKHSNICVLVLSLTTFTEIL